MPLPVVMVSSLTQSGAKTTLEALEAGAVDFVAKIVYEIGAVEKQLPLNRVADGILSLI